MVSGFSMTKACRGAMRFARETRKRLNQEDQFLVGEVAGQGVRGGVLSHFACQTRVCKRLRALSAPSPRRGVRGGRRKMHRFSRGKWPPFPAGNRAEILARLPGAALARVSFCGWRDGPWDDRALDA